MDTPIREISASGHANGVRVEVRGEINRMPMVPSEETWRQEITGTLLRCCIMEQWAYPDDVE